MEFSSEEFPFGPNSVGVQCQLKLIYNNLKFSPFCYFNHFDWWGSWTLNLLQIFLQNELNKNFFFHDGKWNFHPPLPTFELIFAYIYQTKFWDILCFTACLWEEMQISEMVCWLKLQLNELFMWLWILMFWHKASKHIGSKSQIWDKNDIIAFHIIVSHRFLWNL